MAKIENTERRVYACSFLTDPKDEKSALARVKLVPGVNEIDNKLLPGFMGHPGVKVRFELGLLKQTTKGKPFVSEDEKAAIKAKKAADAKKAAEDAKKTE